MSTSDQNELMRALGNIEGKLDSMATAHEEFKIQMSSIRSDLADHKAAVARDKNMIIGGVTVVGTMMTGGWALLHKLTQ